MDNIPKFFAKLNIDLTITDMIRCLSLSETARNSGGYCGLSCNACGIYEGKINQAVENLRRAIGTYGIDRIALELASWEPAFQHYTEFETVLEGLAKVFGIFGSCPGCAAGGGDPRCRIRECCRQKARLTCEECLEMEVCERLIAMPFQHCAIKALKTGLGLNL